MHLPCREGDMLLSLPPVQPPMAVAADGPLVGGVASTSVHPGPHRPSRPPVTERTH